jgi:hypothetical protein
MRPGKEHLVWRIRITKISAQKFWNELFVPKRIEKPGQYIMWTVCKCFTYLSRVVWRKPNSAPIKTQDKALIRVKMVAKLITEYTNRVRGSGKAVLKHDISFGAFI